MDRADVKAIPYGLRAENKADISKAYEWTTSQAVGANTQASASPGASFEPLDQLRLTLEKQAVSRSNQWR